MSSHPLSLPRGLIDTEGRRHRDVALVIADGWLERAVVSAVGAESPRPQVRHELLASCIERVGGYVEPDAATISLLTRGELDLLGFWVRRELVGDAMRLIVPCALPSCGELADVDLTLHDLLPERQTDDPEWFVVDAGDHGRAVLRPFTGADETALEAVPSRDRTAELMARIVRSAELPGAAAGDSIEIDADGWRALPAPLRNTVLVELAERPSGPTTSLEIGCPSCQALVEVRLDPLVLLANELRSGGERVLVETHFLAFHYGWAEEDIFSMPRQRRWAYLSMLRAELTGAPVMAEVRNGW